MDRDLSQQVRQKYEGKGIQHLYKDKRDKNDENILEAFGELCAVIEKKLQGYVCLEFLTLDFLCPSSSSVGAIDYLYIYKLTLRHRKRTEGASTLCNGDQSKCYRCLRLP